MTETDKKKPRTDEEKCWDIRNLIRSTEHYTNHEIMEMMKMIVDAPSRPGGRIQGLGDGRMTHSSELDKYGNFLGKK
tara:strand:+ start:88 stop:318 length:231 start_codon:yes stop_codon:yes gene_type:complete